MRFLTVGEAIALGEMETGSDQLRDFNMLDSAISRPINYVAYAGETADIHMAAAHLLYGIARNHAFLDGNKRVALAATAVFYELNGHELEAPQGELLALVVDTAQGIIDPPTIASQLKPWVVEWVTVAGLDEGDDGEEPDENAGEGA